MSMTLGEKLAKKIEDDKVAWQHNERVKKIKVLVRDVSVLIVLFGLLAWWLGRETGDTPSRANDYGFNEELYIEHEMSEREPTYW